MADVVVAGHVCVDLTPALARPVALAPGTLFGVGPLSVTPGGCVANTGSALAALGADVRVAATVGDDALSAVLVDSLRAAGLDPGGLDRVPGAATSYSIVVEPPDTDRTFWHHAGANDTFDPGRIDLHGARLLHLGYPPLLAGLRARNGDGLARVLDAARADGATTALDLAAFADDADAARADWPAILGRVLPRVDVAAPSADDLTAALGWPPCTNLREASRRAAGLVDLGVAVAVVKAGSLGLALRTAGRERLRDAGAALDESWADADVTVPAFAVQVHGTTGAGDAACAGLLYGILRGLGPRASAVAAAGAAAVWVEGVRPLPRWQVIQERIRNGWPALQPVA